ncbi:aldehyde dehydrogenase [Candidatus Peregrinibacteria bacterium]|nr:aldehyde dehydrogenase [Candidatus Peregrinibacteria bacterium]
MLSARLNENKTYEDARQERFRSSCMSVVDGHVHINGFSILPESIRIAIEEILSSSGITAETVKGDILRVPRQVSTEQGDVNMAAVLGRITGFVTDKRLKRQQDIERSYPDKIDLNDILVRARRLGEHIEAKKENIIGVLIRYETFEVAEDEIQRTLDLLFNLDENSAYFQRKVGPASVFLPSNQPLYSLACFGVVPALMAREVYLKAPSFMDDFFSDLTDVLNLNNHFPNIHVHHGPRQQFVKACSTIRTDSETGKSETACDVVIFTGQSEKANMLRKAFHERVLFIVNGAGHNPIVVTETADINEAVRSAIHVQLYNQGQDCAGPNAILVHGDVYDAFMARLTEELRKIKVGPYTNRENTVGPISRPDDLSRIQRLINENIQYLSPETDGVTHARRNIVEPTIIEKPLDDGGNYREQFAPIFFVQRYGRDEDLDLYFGDEKYRKNAMYVTVFGKSEFVDRLVGDPEKDANCVHRENTIVRNTDLHAPGVERGTQPYGGYGRNASYICINGKIIRKPTLPQRDIFEHLVKPTL